MTALLTLFLMNYKGLCVLHEINNIYPGIIKYVISSKDENVQNDYYKEIINYCIDNNIIFYDRKEMPDSLKWDYAIVIGWRWIIKNTNNLIVFHDSLLPKYRGFNPLVTALINGDNEIGVTALFASDKADEGDIIKQEKINIEYPIKIEKAIEIITELYKKIAISIVKMISNNLNILAIPQNHAVATYSIWRDDKDYIINWNMSSAEIKRMVDASGYPYTCAISKLDSTWVKIIDAAEVPDLVIVNRICGKIMKIENECPIVICKTGLLKLIKITSLTNENFRLSKLKSRFAAES